MNQNRKKKKKKKTKLAHAQSAALMKRFSQMDVPLS